MTSFIFQMFQKMAKARNIMMDKAGVAKKWYRDMGKKVTNVSGNDFLKSNKDNLMKNNTFSSKSIGQMYCFYYDPKHKATLPYYDRFPLIFPIKVVKGGFLGLNMHYLPPVLRAKLMDALYKTATTNEKDEKKRLRISYDILQSAAKFKYFKPCLKMYLYGHVRSKFLPIAHEEWDLVLFLPLERFEKASKQQVWKDSAKKVGATY